MTDAQSPTWLDRLKTIKDLAAVGRAFGDSYAVDGTTLIPVATVWGGGGGGRDTGARKEQPDHPVAQNLGLGLGARVRPVGIVVVKDGRVTWQPTIDVTRIVAGAQLLALGALLVLARRRSPKNS